MARCGECVDSSSGVRTLRWRVDLERKARAREQAKSEAASAAYESALEAIDRMLTRVGVERLRESPNMTEIRQALVADAIELYEELSGIQSDERELRQRRADALRRASVLLAELGRMSEGIEAGERAERELVALLAEFPQDLEVRRVLAATREALGRAYFGVGRDEEALAVIDGVNALFDEDALDGPAKLIIAESMQWQAEVIAKTRGIDQAAPILRRALDLLESSLDDGESFAEVSFSSVAILQSYGVMLVGDQRGALDHDEEIEWAYTKAYDVMKDLVEEGEPDANCLFQFHMTQNNLAGLYRHRESWEEAEPLYIAAEKGFRSLVERFPALYMPRYELATVLNNLGLMDVDRRRYAEAGVRYGESVEQLEELVQRFPDVPQLRANLATLHHNAAIRAQDQRDLEGFEVHARAAIEHNRRAIELDPDVPRYRYHQAENLAHLGLLYLLTDRIEDSLAIAQELVVADPGSRASWGVARDHLVHALRAVLARYEVGPSEGEDLGVDYALLLLDLAETGLDSGWLTLEQLREERVYLQLRELEVFSDFIEEIER